MVDIKGLDKARVMEALKNEAIRSADAPEMHRNVFGGEISHEQSCKRVTADLSGDEFDERGYDSIFEEGAAQRAVDSVRAEREEGKDAAGNTDGEKKELTMEEKAKLTKDTIVKVLDILMEVPPDMASTVRVILKLS